MIVKAPKWKPGITWKMKTIEFINSLEASRVSEVLKKNE